MWRYNIKVTLTHAKIGTQMAWAMFSNLPGLSNVWVQIRPMSPDGVSNVFTILTTALANNRLVDVFVVNNQIEQVSMK